LAKIIVVGGGWSGCAASLAAAKSGAEVVLLERTDMLLGTGLVGGIFRNNGRYTAAEESIDMGGGDFFLAMDKNCRHRDVAFPGHRHACLYDVTRMEPLIRKILQGYGVKMEFRTRVSDVEKSGRRLHAVSTDDGRRYEGEAFVDATGSAGPMGNCLTYGNGCAMCILRCPSFGPRISVCHKAGVTEVKGRRKDGGIGAMSGSCKLNKDSLSPALRETLESDGVAILPIPPSIRKKNALLKKACSQYALPEFAENIILLDTGHAKLMTSYFALNDLRQIKGLENAKYEDPYSGGQGNSMRYMGVALCDDNLRADKMENLFCGGEKSGVIVGHTEAIVTGLLAGNNAVRCVLDMEYLTLPPTIASGDFIHFVHNRMRTEEGLKLRYTFSGSVYFERMRQLGLYSVNNFEIKERIKNAGLHDIYAANLV